jgi:hypothetical protein
MPLFSRNPLRSAAIAAIVLSFAHFSTQALSSLNAFHFTQTSIGVLTLAALIFVVLMHHKMEGQVMTEGQEEMLLIGMLALMWMVILVGWKSFRAKNGGGGGVSTDVVSNTPQKPGRYSDPCLNDNTLCVYEEWYSYW